MWIAVDETKSPPVRRLVRPGRSYVIGPRRGSANEFRIDGLDAHVSRRLITVDAAEWAAEDAASDDGGPPKPPYELRLTYVPKREIGSSICRGDRTIQLIHGQSVAVEHGDELEVAAGKLLRFHWEPVAFFFSVLKDADRRMYAERLARLGMQLAVRAPAAHHTHHCSKTLRINMPLGYFAVRLRPLVSRAFLDAVVSLGEVVDPGPRPQRPAFLPEEPDYSKMTKDEKVAYKRKEGERMLTAEEAKYYRDEEEWQSWKLSTDDRWDGQSKLEKDLDAYWPNEADARWFPNIPTAGMAMGERARWAIKQGRKTLLEKACVVFFEDDPQLAIIQGTIEGAGGKVLHYDLAANLDKNASSIAAEIESAQASGGATEARQLVLMRPRNSLEDAVFDTADAVADKLGIAHMKASEDLLNSIYLVQPAKFTDPGEPSISPKRPQATARPGAAAQDHTAAVDGRRAAAPPSSGPPGFQDTERVEAPVAASRATRSRTGKAPPSAEPSASKGPPPASEDMLPPTAPAKRKLTRRAKTHDTDAMLDEIMGLSAPSEFMSSNAAGVLGDSVPMEIDLGSDLPTATSSRRARLKRRAGALPDDDDSLAPSSSHLFDTGTQTRASKRQRSEEPNQIQAQPSLVGNGGLFSIPESQMPPASQSHLPQRARTQKRKTSPSRSEAETEADGSGKAARKRRRHAAASADEEEERAQPTQSHGRGAKDRKAGKRGNAADEEESHADEKGYLAIDAGRKRLTEAERDLNEEFNKLKIPKAAILPPAKVESVRMGWNDRDLDEEELKEMEGWTREDAGKTSFVIRKMEVKRKERPPPTAYDPFEDSRWAGLPNFKRFRPKTVERALPWQRPGRKLELSIMEDAGESTGRSRSAQIPVTQTNTQPQRTQPQPQLQPRFSPPEEANDGDEDDMPPPSKQSKGHARPVPKARGLRSRSVTVDVVSDGSGSGSDSDDSAARIGQNLTGKPPPPPRRATRSTQSSTGGPPSQTRSQARTETQTLRSQTPAGGTKAKAGARARAKATPEPVTQPTRTARRPRGAVIVEETASEDEGAFKGFSAKKRKR